MAFDVLRPGALHRGLEGHHQHTLESQPFSKLVSSKGLAKTHFCIPEKSGCLPRVILSGRAIVKGSFLHRLPLLGAHSKIPVAIFLVFLSVLQCQVGSLHLFRCTGKPFPVNVWDASFSQNTVQVMVGEYTAVFIDCAVLEYNAVGYPAW